MRNFTVADTLGIVKACLILFPFMFAPGYVAGWRSTSLSSGSGDRFCG